jgi:hypothetical protein
MTTFNPSQTNNRSATFNRVFYGLFVVLSLYFLIKGEPASAMSNLGMALIFDPFDSSIRWDNRPLYQKTWLFVHVALVFILLAYTLLTTFKFIQG